MKAVAFSNCSENIVKGASSMTSSSRLKVFLISTFLVSSALAMALTGLHAGISHASGVGVTAANWSQAGYDAQHTCVNPNEHILNSSNVFSLSLDWTYAASSDVSNGEAVVNGIVYVTSYGGVLYALDAQTGALKWSYATGSSMQLDTPAVAGGLVYFGTLDDNVYALDALTGVLKWRYNTGGAIYDSPTIANGVLYIGAATSTHTLFALDAKSGALKWSFTPASGYGNFSTPMVYNSMVYVGSDNQDVFALDGITGKVRWHQTVNSSVFAAPSAINGIVYVSTGSG
jgi:outer membrane protein assembly factor BamB